VAAVVAATALCWFTRAWFSIAEQVMVYVLCVLATSVTLARREAILTAMFSVAAFDFFFVPPVFGFAPTDMKHLVTLIGFMATSLVVSSYAATVRHQAVVARRGGSNAAGRERAPRLRGARFTRESLLLPTSPGCGGGSACPSC
jgi:two-component system, OmpR family, sensor histidine kinase KdpD